MPHYYYDDRFGSGHVFGAGLMVFFSIILIALGVWLIVALVRKTATPAPVAPAPVVTPRAGESARDILDRRFAMGELTEEQYLAMRKALQGPGEVQA